MRRHISIFLALMIIFVSLPALAATEYEEKDGFQYIKDTNIITAYVGEEEEIVIPENTKLMNGFEFSEYDKVSETVRDTVKKITISNNVEYEGEIFKRSYCHKYATALEEVVFAEGITHIPDYAFYGFSSLKKVTFPTTLKTIGAYTFTYNYNGGYSAPQITSLYIPDSVTDIGEKSFAGCKNITEMNLPESLQVIGNGAFGDVHVKSLNIPENYLKDKKAFVPDADEYIFEEMTVNIYKSLINKTWTEEKYLKGLTDKTMGKYEDFIILDNVLLKYIGSDRKPEVPSEVTEFCNGAFKHCDIETVFLPNGLKVIPMQAFYYSGLEYIDIPPSVTTIENAAFCGTKIKSLFIPKTVEELAENFASKCYELEEVVFEGTPKIEAFFNDSYKLKREKVYFLDDSVVVPEEFWEFETIHAPEETAQPKPTQQPISTIEPTQKPISTIEPTATPSEEPIEETEKITVSQNGGEIKVAINNNEVVFPDAKPFIDEEQRTQVPVRALSENLGYDVLWDGESKKVKLTKEKTILFITIGAKDINRQVIIGDIERPSGFEADIISMDTEARVIEDRTYVPLRFVAEALGYEVEWQ